MGKDSRQAAFDREFREHIERFTEPLVSALSQITAAELPPVVKVLSFEMQSDWRSFSVHLAAMDDKAPHEVYFEAPFNGRILPGAGELIPEGAIDQDAYEEAGVDTFVSGARVMAEWFGECWHAAGVRQVPHSGVHQSARQVAIL